MGRDEVLERLRCFSCLYRRYTEELEELERLVRQRESLMAGGVARVFELSDEKMLVECRNLISRVQEAKAKIARFRSDQDLIVQEQCKSEDRYREEVLRIQQKSSESRRIPLGKTIVHCICIIYGSVFVLGVLGAFLPIVNQTGMGQWLPLVILVGYVLSVRRKHDVAARMYKDKLDSIVQKNGKKSESRLKLVQKIADQISQGERDLDRLRPEVERLKDSAMMRAEDLFKEGLTDLDGRIVVHGQLCLCIEEQLEKEGILPSKDDWDIVEHLERLVASGRADSIKEALVLFDESERAEQADRDAERRNETLRVALYQVEKELELARAENAQRQREIEELQRQQGKMLANQIHMVGEKVGSLTKGVERIGDELEKNGEVLEGIYSTNLDINRHFEDLFGR